MKKRSSGFTLIDMLVATVLASVLIGADLAIVGRLSKDRQLIATHADPAPPRGLTDLLTWDLSQSATVDDSQLNSQPGTLTLVGHGGIDHATLLPNQRWTSVSYRIVVSGGRSSLWRTQEYLDDPARPERWQEWIGDGITGLSMQSSADATITRLQIERTAGSVQVEWRR